MNYKTHILGGITAMTILNEIGTGLDIELASITTLGVIIGSIFPDIDHPKSYIGRRTKLTSYVVSAVSKHRGILHTPFFNALIALCLSFGVQIFYPGVQSHNLVRGITIGLFSHIFLDTLTKQGIPLLYPFSKKNFKVVGINTGGVFEKVLCVVMVLLSWKSY